MKTSSIILFIIGLLFECIAFFGNQASNIPFVMKIVAPGYVNAQIAMQTLKETRALEPDDKGFSEIASMLTARLHSPDNPQAVSEISVQRLTRGNASIGLGRNSAGERIPIKMFLSNGQELKFDISILRKDIETLKTKNLFIYATITFFIGVLIQCIAFITEHRNKKMPNNCIKTDCQH